MIVRGLTTLFRARRRPAIGLLEESVVTLRVWPQDLDIAWHLNNGRYLSLMDLGRLDLLERTQLFGAAMKRGWLPVVGAIQIRYRRSLELFQRFEIRSRLLAWDEKWFTIDQRFLRGGETAAQALVRGVFRGKEGSIPAAEVLRAIGLEGAAAASPAAPDEVRAWTASLDARRSGDYTSPA